MDPGNRRFARETVAALSFPRQRGAKTIYLHHERVKEGFIHEKGAIKSFSASWQDARGGEGGIATFVVAKTGGETTGQTTVEFDLSEPLSQALLLRASLAREEGSLATDIEAAGIGSYVLARGPGGITYPYKKTDFPLNMGANLPPEAATELLQEHARRLGTRRGDDSHPEYYPCIVQTSGLISVALCGGREMRHSNALAWEGSPLRCGIFGEKRQAWRTWALIIPFHVWYEPVSS